MSLVRLAGCRSDSLLGYLKAVGVLRLLSSQAGTFARGSWEDATFILEACTPESIVNFLVGAYAPTVILNPWNNGSGFDGKLDKAAETMRRVKDTTHVRWLPYRRALEFIDARYIRTGLRRHFLDAGDKRGFIRSLRAHCSEDLLPWLDACLVLTSERLEFPFLLGSGGNDGRLDFSANFALRALDVCGDGSGAESKQLLEDSLYDNGSAKLNSGAAIGQFSPRHAGGANATTGFDADSLVNPWDYVLMMEGAVLFSGSIGRRTERGPGRALFPFAVAGVAGGYGSSSDEEGVRGEVWLPVWDGFASLASLSDLLRKGRMDLPSDGRASVRNAAYASDAVASVATLGVAFGVRRFERVAFVQRNGLAFSGAFIGSVTANDQYDAGIAVISRDLASWLDAVRRRNLGARARESLRAFDGALFGFPSIPANDRTARARARQDILMAIVDLNRALKPSWSDIRELPRIEASALKSLDDGSTLHRVCAAIASIGGGRNETDTWRYLRDAGDDAIATLRGLLETRLRADSGNPSAGWLRPASELSASDAIAFLGLGAAGRRRFNRLLRAYALILLNLESTSTTQEPGPQEFPAAYALLKLVFDNPRARDARILRFLFAADAPRALAVAVRRARTIHDLPAGNGPRDVSQIDLEDPAWAGAALAAPISRSTGHYRWLLDAALKSRTKYNEAEAYAKTISFGERKS